ncbi:MAG: WYL domain-containing protein [Nitrospinae bacterium]|nr:WYL domain-containing protein [Nitrospinota bacterium]
MNPKSKRFPDRMRKIHRLISILRVLDNRQRCTPEILAEKFGTTTRNIFRDMNELYSSGFAIIFDKQSDTYAFTDPDFTLRDLDLNNDELLALLLGKKLGHTLGKPIENAFNSLLKKAHKDTGEKTKGKIKRLEDRQWFWVDLDPMDDFEKIEKQYNAIVEAMDKNHEIEIGYQGMHGRKETRRQIAPYGLFFHSGMWYVLAYCNLRSEIREFALDCIKDIKITNSYYTIPHDFNMDDYFKSGWHIMRYGEPVEVVLKFSKDIAQWIKRLKWHPTQKINEQKDGSIIFKVRLEGTKEIKWWTYHWAPNCEIISPPELRKEAAEEIRKLGRVYGKKKK